jgi:hypothetical protein
VVRPARPPRGGPPALSRGCAAIWGLNPDPAWARIGCARPARRLHALRAQQSRGCRTGFPDGGPLFAFAPPQRPIAAPPHRPAGRTGWSDDASSPGLSFPTTHDGTADPRSLWARVPPPAPRAASGVSSPPSRRPPPSLPTPEGAGASMGFPLQGLLLAPDGYPSRSPCPRAVPRVDSPLPMGSDGRGRLQGLVPGASSCSAHPCGHAGRCLPEVPPSRAFPLPVRALAFWIAGPPPPRVAV